MASSGEIWAQLKACEHRIEECRIDIRKTEHSLEDQEFYYARFLAKKENYLGSFEYATTRTNQVEAFAAFAKIARRYHEKMSVLVGVPKDNSVQALENAGCSFRSSIEKTGLKLEDLRMELRRLEGQAAQLYDDYQHALAREAEARRRAAEAAAAAAAGRRA